MQAHVLVLAGQSHLVWVGMSSHAAPPLAISSAYSRLAATLEGSLSRWRRVGPTTPGPRTPVAHEHLAPLHGQDRYDCLLHAHTRAQHIVHHPVPCVDLQYRNVGLP